MWVMKLLKRNFDFLNHNLNSAHAPIYSEEDGCQSYKVSKNLSFVLSINLPEKQFCD
jgi:hypothetical protein